MSTVLELHVSWGASSLSSTARAPNHGRISAVSHPVMGDSVIVTVALVVLNHPGNFRVAPFLIVRAPFTVRGSFRNASMDRGSVVTTLLSRMSTPPAATVREYRC